MSKIQTTGYLAKTNGQTTNIDLTTSTKWVSSRVRWKGKDTNLSDNNYVTGTNYPYPIMPNVPSGYTWSNTWVTYYSKVTNIGATNVSVRFNYILNGGTNVVGGWVALTPGQSTTQGFGGYTAADYAGTTFFNAWEEAAAKYSSLSTTDALNTARAYGTKTVITTNPQITVGGTNVAYAGTLANGVVSAWSNIPAGISAGQVNVVTNNFDSSSGGYVEIEDTFEPMLPLGTVDSPANDTRTVTAAVAFIFNLIEDTDNSAVKYHARIRLDDYSSIPAPTVYQSKDDQTNWEYWTGAAYAAFPAGGVDPGTKVKYTKTLALGISYWDIASWDGYGYGSIITPYKIKIVITVNNLYFLDIDGTEYDAYSLRVVETSNGEIGEIVAVINNAGGTNFGAINYQDVVLVAFNDELGNTEDFAGKVRNKNPSGEDLEIYAILGDGILAERIIQENYADQDIGVTVAAIIADYCAGLTSTNVDLTTGFSEAILTDNKTPLKVLEELRKNYGIFFYVDKDWDLHFYLPADITATPTASIRYGD